MPEMQRYLRSVNIDTLFKMVLNGRFDIPGLVAGCKVYGQVDDHFELCFFGKILDRIDNIMSSSFSWNGARSNELKIFMIDEILISIRIMHFFVE